MQDNEAVEEYWDRVFKLTRLGNIPKFRHLSKLIQVSSLGNIYTVGQFLSPKSHSRCKKRVRGGASVDTFSKIVWYFHLN